MYEDAGWEILPELLDGSRHGTRLLASHYPYVGDTTGADRHSSHRPVDTGIPLLHGHTHERDFGPHGSHEFHVGVDAFDFAPIPFELIDAWLEDLRRKEEEIAAIVRERSAAGDSTPLDDRPGAAATVRVLAPASTPPKDSGSAPDGQDGDDTPDPSTLFGR